MCSLQPEGVTESKRTSVPSNSKTPKGLSVKPALVCSLQLELGLLMEPSARATYKCLSISRLELQPSFMVSDGYVIYTTQPERSRGPERTGGSTWGMARLSSH